MDITISPARALGGSLQLPGDKSISHRYAILASLAEGTTTIRNYSTGADCRSTLRCVKGLGVPVRGESDEVVIEGQGLRGLKPPGKELDAGNSGSTIRMLSGVLAAQPFTSRIGGDDSLSRRPMLRIIRPLSEMGATIGAKDDQFPPLEISGGPLRPIEYRLPVASAQVKSCVLFAGLFAEGRTTVIEPLRTRDHTEIALREFGAEIESAGGRISVAGGPRLKAQALTVPGDISSAAFFLVAALMVREASITIEGVGLNPTRAALLDFLTSMGAKIRILDVVQTHGEPGGTVQIQSSPIEGGVIEQEMTAALIDEIPVLGVLGARSRYGLEVRDAGELRVKETDRIAAVTENLRRMGVNAEAREDGFRVPGNQELKAAQLESCGDHRIAMAFAVAALAADGPCVIRNAGAASISYPGFFETLGRLKG